VNTSACINVESSDILTLQQFSLCFVCVVSTDRSHYLFLYKIKRDWVKLILTQVSALSPHHCREKDQSTEQAVPLWYGEHIGKFVWIVYLFYHHHFSAWKADSKHNQWYSKKGVISWQNINLQFIQSFIQIICITNQTLLSDFKVSVLHCHHYLVSLPFTQCDLNAFFFFSIFDQTRSNISAQCILNHLSWNISQFIHKSVNLFNMISTTVSGQLKTIIMILLNLRFNLNV